MNDAHQTPPTVAAARFLVVEDDEGLAELLCEILRRQGWLCRRAATGTQAIEAIAAQFPDLVLLDYSLPDMTAEELVKRLPAPPPPFIVVTGHGSERVAVEMMKRGARDYLVKDVILMDRLVPVVQRVLRQVVAEREFAAAEKELQARQEKLREALKLESLVLMAGGIAHEFNNLLMAILGHLDLAIQRVPETDPNRPSLAMIRQATLRAADLSRQMLMFTGKAMSTLRPVSLTDVVRQGVQAFRQRLPERISLKLSLPDTVPWVEADAEQLRLVLQNLLTNAQEAIQTTPGTITVSVGETDLSASDLQTIDLTAARRVSPTRNRFALMRVTDTGCGMDDAAQRRIFDPFYSTKFAGRGLGLAVVQGIVRGHGGVVLTASKPGQGTSMTVCIPLQSAAATSEPATAGAEATGGPTVLILDPDAGVCRLLRRTLQVRGLVALTSESSAAGLRLLAGHRGRIEAMVVDLTLADAEGGLLAQLRDLAPGVPVILTGSSCRQAAERLLGPSAFAYFIEKPYEPRDLVERISQVIRDGTRGLATEPTC